MDSDTLVPDTRVLAIASHVRVMRTIAVRVANFCMAGGPRVSIGIPVSRCESSHAHQLCGKQNGDFRIAVPWMRRFGDQHGALQLAFLRAQHILRESIDNILPGNHTAYKQVKGTKTSADEIEELYEGLRQSNLNDFDCLLTGYMPSAEAVKAVGKIGRDLKYNAVSKPGSFFWGGCRCP